jgi:hypothetical protein
LQEQQEVQHHFESRSTESSRSSSTGATQHGGAAVSSSSSSIESSSADGFEGLDSGLAWLPQQEKRPSGRTQQQQQQHVLHDGRPILNLRPSRHQQQREHGLSGLAGMQQPEAVSSRASMDLQQLQEALQTGYGLDQGLPAIDSSACDPALLLSGADSNVLAQQQQQQQGLEAQGWWDDDVQQEEQVDQQLLQHEQGLQQLDAALADKQLLVNADSREQRWRLRRMRRRLQQSTAAPQPGSGATYYGAAAAAANGSSPSIAFGLVRVDSTVLSFTWQPKVSVTPAVLSLPVGSTATLQYNVKLLRTQLPNRVLLRGSVLLRNPLASPVKLGEVAVEAPAAGQPAWGYSAATCSMPSDSSASDASIAGILASSVTVPAKGQLMCSFVLSYPAEAPAQGVVFARAVTDAGKELVSAPFSFTRPAVAPAAAQAASLGACAMVSDTFLSATENPAVLAPSKVPASGTKAPEAAASALGAGSSKGGVLLCNSAAYAYTATLGPYRAGQCGRFKVSSSCWYAVCSGSNRQHLLNSCVHMCHCILDMWYRPGVCCLTIHCQFEVLLCLHATPACSIHQDRA